MVSGIQPDGFTPKVIKQTDDYLYAEFQVGPRRRRREVRDSLCNAVPSRAHGGCCACLGHAWHIAASRLLLPQSPTFGFIDDVEFWFKAGQGSRVEYRSASRWGRCHACATTMSKQQQRQHNMLLLLLLVLLSHPLTRTASTAASCPAPLLRAPRLAAAHWAGRCLVASAAPATHLSLRPSHHLSRAPAPWRALQDWRERWQHQPQAHPSECWLLLRCGNACGGDASWHVHADLAAGAWLDPRCGVTLRGIAWFVKLGLHAWAFRGHGGVVQHHRHGCGQPLAFLQSCSSAASAGTSVHTSHARLLR